MGDAVLIECTNTIVPAVASPPTKASITTTYKVIGFKSNPKPCDYRYVIFRIAVALGNSVVVVFDTDTMAPAVITGVTFPCLATDANYVAWLATKKTDAGFDVVGGLNTYGNSMSQRWYDGITSYGWYYKANNYPPATNTDGFYDMVTPAGGGYVYDNTWNVYALRSDYWFRWNSSGNFLIKNDGTISNQFIGYSINMALSESRNPGIPFDTVTGNINMVDYFGDTIRTFGGQAGWNQAVEYFKMTDLTKNPLNYKPRLYGTRTSTLSVLFNSFELWSALPIGREFLASVSVRKRLPTVKIEDADILTGSRDATLSALIVSAFELAYTPATCRPGVQDSAVSFIYAV